MERFIFAAEADKIQDFVFRSSRLREVVGGSQLLSRFCQEVPQLILQKLGIVGNTQIVIADGGAFRIIFEKMEDAEAFGELLAETYAHATDSTLSVAHPVQIGTSGFAEANAQVQVQLRESKTSDRGVVETAHMPFIAYCASCGTGLAEKFDRKHPDEDANYICRSCLNKGAERDAAGSFLDSFRLTMKRALVRRSGETGLSDTELNKMRFAMPSAEDLGAVGPQNHVAYLVADGNRMGRLFGRCQTPEALMALSVRLNQVVKESLARTAADIFITQRSEKGEDGDKLAQGEWLPILPLILGGDDCFALLPARYAVAAAQRFCVYFETMMSAQKAADDGEDPTMAAAVVVCKSSYPYAAAHEGAETLLRSAKTLARQIKSQGMAGSTLNFSLIQGSQRGGEMEAGSYRGTARPYRTGDEGYSDEINFPLCTLINARKELSSAPGEERAKVAATMLQNIRVLYDEAGKMSQSKTQSVWRQRATELLIRLEREPEAKGIVEQLLTVDGKKNQWWLHLWDEGSYHGHFLPDVIEMWDFLQPLAAKEDRP